MAATKTNWVTQIGNMPVIDVRRFGAIGDGNTSRAAANVTAIQAALDAVPWSAGSSTTQANAPNIVYIPAGRYAVNSALKVRIPGTIIWAEGQCGGDQTNQLTNSGSILVPTSGFSGTEVLRWDPADATALLGGTFQELRSMGIKGLGIDLTAAPTLTGFLFRSVSNAAVIQDIWTTGGTSYGIRFTTSQAIPACLPCEGVTMVNCYVWSGNPGTSQNMSNPMLSIEGCNEFLVLGGKYLLNSQVIGSNIVPPTNNTPGIQVTAFANGVGTVSAGNGIAFVGVSVANPQVHLLIKGMTNGGGTRFVPQAVTCRSCTFETYNVAIRINKESGAATFQNSFGMSFDQTNRLLTPYNVTNGGLETQKIADVDFMDGGVLEAENIVFTGGSSGSGLGQIVLGSNTFGVRVYAGNSPNTAGVAPAIVNSGLNSIEYSASAYNGGVGTFAGRMFSGTLTALGTKPSTDAVPTSSTSGGGALQALGDTQRLFSTSRVISGTTGPAGVFGETCLFQVAGLWYLAYCVQTGGAGVANWVRVGLVVF